MCLSWTRRPGSRCRTAIPRTGVAGTAGCSPLTWTVRCCPVCATPASPSAASPSTASGTQTAASPAGGTTGGGWRSCAASPVSPSLSRSVWNAYNYERTGTPNRRVTYICEMHKARVLAQCYHHNRLHLQDPDHQPKKMHIPMDWAIPIIGVEEYEALLALERQCFES